MSSVSIAGDTSGSVLLTAPAVSGSTQINIAAQSGTLNVGGPAFSAYRSGSDQTISNATNTKVQVNTESFDTNNCFDSSTNYRFTPTVAGYYFFVGTGIFGQGSNSVQCYIYKNGSVALVNAVQNQASGSGNVSLSVSGLLYMNGTTDYAEFYVYQSSGGNLTLYAGSYLTYFQGYLARTA